MKIIIDKKAVGSRINQIRIRKGYTLEAFGKLFSVSKSNVLKWEQGQSLPNKERLVNISKLADLTVNELLYGSIDEFLENNIKAIYIRDELNIILKKKPVKDFIRRIFDIIMSIILLVLSFPICVITIILIKADIGFIKCLRFPTQFLENPSFFIQKRIGKDRKIIKIIKFRSMIIHDSNNYSKYPLEKDERITWIGNIIRKTRIDELPQLFCVLKGTMSFVGPRPEWDELVDEYEKKIPYYNLRHLIKPGITGWAQIQYIYGSGVEDAKVKLSYELYYLKHQSIFLDLKIILKTIKVIFSRKGM